MADFTYPVAPALDGPGHPVGSRWLLWFWTGLCLALAVGVVVLVANSGGRTSTSDLASGPLEPRRLVTTTTPGDADPGGAEVAGAVAVAENVPPSVLEDLTGQSALSAGDEPDAAPLSPPDPVSAEAPIAVAIPKQSDVWPPPGPSGNALPPYLGIMGQLAPTDTNGRTDGGSAPNELGAGRAPLTGLAAPRIDRPAIVAKLDNGSRASRPQAGLDQADIVYEQRVEGNSSRLAAVFQSQDPGVLGPIRSGRTSDIGIIGSLNTPIFSWGGSNEVFVNLLRAQPLVDRGSNVFGGYARSGSRRAPHNLFTDTTELWASAGGGAPAPHFAFRAGDGPLRNPSVPASSILVAFGPTQIEYRWDPARGGWARSQDGTAHTATSGVQITPQNVVLQYIDYVDTGMRDTAKSVVPEAVMVGRGRAVVLTDGAAIEGKWTKASLSDVTRFTDPSGKLIEFTPGTTFVELTTEEAATFR